ncbi:MAG: hypothetical protein NC184_05635 [Roseburia sp.]|nr:hypothetical protein [Roseburia sp.]
MRFDDVIWTDKMRAIFSDDAPVIHLCGAMGTSKTLVAGLLFFDRVMNAPANVNQFAIIGVSSVLAKRNFVDKADSLYNIHRGLCTPYSDGDKDAAGSHFCINGNTGKKIVYIAGADNKSSYQNILSLDLGGILLDELSALHPDVWREAYGRVQRLAYPGWLITTTNGGNPTQEFYPELVNHATVKFRDTVPKIELDEMVEDRADEHYYHFNLRDDCPHKTAAQTERLINSYPVGSFYYYSKILGCRGFAEGALYAPLLNDVPIIGFADLNLSAFEEVVATVDVGASINGDDTNKSHTIVALGGYTRQYHRVVAIASKKIASIEHRDIIDEAEEWLYPYWLKFYGKFRAILIDKADYKLVSTWQNHSRWRGKVSVLGCIKSDKHLCPDLPTRAAVKCQLMMQSKQYPTSRIVWCDEQMLKAHRQILQDKDGAELDQSNIWQDYADCFSYLILWRIQQILADATRRPRNKIQYY